MPETHSSEPEKSVTNTQRFNDFYDSILPAAYAKLATQPIELHRLFCAACCERLTQNYAIYHRITGVGSLEKMRGILDLLWDVEVRQVAEGARRTIWLDLDMLILPGYRGTFWSILAEFTISALQQTLIYLDLVTGQPTKIGFIVKVCGEEIRQPVKLEV